LTPPEKSAQKFLGLPFYCNVEHVQLRNITVDVMNIIVTITVGVKCAPESQNASKRTILKEKIQFFSGEEHSPFPDLTPTREGIPLPRFYLRQRLRCFHSSALGTRTPSPKNISGYGPACVRSSVTRNKLNSRD